MSILPTTLHALIGCKPSDKLVQELVQGKEPESIKAYSDVVYYNYTSQGISLQFSPSSSYKPPRTATKRSDLKEALLSLSTIDIYSSTYPSFPIKITYLPPSNPNESSPSDIIEPLTLDLKASATGRDLVSKLGEPDRKGGGESKSVGVWLEWLGLGLMTEFTGVHGAHKWDNELGAGASTVGVWSFFEPGKEVGEQGE